MTTQNSDIAEVQQSTRRIKRVKDPVRIPIWRRLTAAVSLGSIIVIVAILVALSIALTALLVLVFLERAALG